MRGETHGYPGDTTPRRNAQGVGQALESVETQLQDCGGAVKQPSSGSQGRVRAERGFHALQSDVRGSMDSTGTASRPRQQKANHERGERMGQPRASARGPTRAGGRAHAANQNHDEGSICDRAADPSPCRAGGHVWAGCPVVASRSAAAIGQVASVRTDLGELRMQAAEEHRTIIEQLRDFRCSSEDPS